MKKRNAEDSVPYIRKSGTLSTSSLEVLAIIAYNQPVTRAFVDTLRRVDSSYAVGNLLDRGLIEAKGRLDVPGRPMIYGTTSDFLRSFGLRDLSELPKTTDELISAFEGAKAQTASQNGEQPEQISLDLDEAMPTANEIDEAIASSENDETLSNEVSMDEPSCEDDISDS